MAYLVGPDSIAPQRRGTRPEIMTADIVRCPAPVSIEPLAEILESAILPRLMAAHDFMPRYSGRVKTSSQPRPLDVEALVSFALDTDADALLDHVDALLGQGVSIESLFVGLLAPSARHLGVLWEQDRCDFIDVTMGLWRLQEVVRELAARFPPGRQAGGGSHHALFAAVPDDQHSFGTVLIDETFRREGWTTEALLDPTRSDLIERIASASFDVLGLTVSRNCNIGPLPDLIHALRSVSRNPRIVVMVGGRVFMEDPLLATAVGADGTAPDAVQAVAVADSLVHAVVHEVYGSG